jgi:hypothetical protein
VDLPAALLGHLQDLADSIGLDDQDREDTLAALTTALRSAAASYCGFQMTLVENLWPVTLTVFTGHVDIPIRTSLRLPLALVSRGVDPESRVLFFASTRGAFTDLATDLSHVLGGVRVTQQSVADIADHGSKQVHGQRSVIALDADLSPLCRKSRLTGLAELTVMSRAIGMLVDQGHRIEQAHEVLHQEAEAAGMDAHIYAVRVLRRRT